MLHVPGLDKVSPDDHREDAFKSLFHRMPIASMLVEAETSRVLDVNRVFVSLFGWLPEQIVGQLSSESPLWVSKQLRRKLLEQFKRDGQLDQFEAVFRCANGSFKTCVVSMENIEVNGVACRLSMAHDITARIQAEQALRTSEEKYLKAFNASHEAIMVMDLESDHLLEINHSFQRITGLDSEQVIGRTLMDLGLLDADTHARLDRIYQQNGRLRNTEVSVTHPKGKKLDLLLYAESVKVNGRDCLVVTAHDITARKQRDQALLESQERLNLSLDAAQMGIWDCNPQTGLLHCSPRAAQLHGYPVMSWNGPITEFMRSIPAEDRRALRRGYIAIVRGDQSRYRLAYRTTVPGKATRWLEVTAKIHRDSQDKVIRMVGTLMDITERRRSEQELMLSEAKFASLFQGAPDPYTLINATNHAIIEVNKSFIETFGYKPQEVVGKTALEAGLWHEPHKRPAIIQRILREKALKGVEIDFRTRDGSVITCEVSSSYININRQLCMLSTFKDITARNQAISQLKASEDKFSRAFRASPDSISITERDSGRYLDVNEGFTRLTGFNADEVIGKTSSELGIWTDPADRRALLAELDKEGRIRHREMLVTGKHGKHLMVAVSLEPIEVNDLECIMMTARDVTEQKLIEAQVKHLAYHDALTDLPNRLLLTDRLKQALALCERQHQQGALLFFDLDHFKHINDSLGHSCGDAVLQEVTRRLLGQVRRIDTVARLGGDEFVVLLCGLEGELPVIEKQVRQSAAKLLAELSTPMLIEGHSLQLSCSIGIALLPEHGDSPEDLLKRADIALYQVKAGGRNGMAFFEQAMQVAASERLSVESELRQALVKNEFRLFYQPQFDAQLQRIIGAEALIRWQHPEKGMTGPLSFIHVLEESGMILDVGNWVLLEACKLIARLLDQSQINADQFSLSVNISPRQFRQPDFVERVDSAISNLNIPPSCLKLEITENIVIQNVNDTIAKMLELREMGVRFAIDDFGTGYSSLSYLKRLPLDQLKIDQSFVRDCTRDPNDAEIIRAIIAMARNLSLELIAEGVETAEQLAFLQEQSCHAYQGYLFSPPIEEQMFIELLKKQGRS